MREKWDRRKEAIIASPTCPRRADGSQDQSAVDYRLAAQTMWGYRERDPEQRARVGDMLIRLLSDEAVERGKPKPVNYAERTVTRAIEQLNVYTAAWEGEVGLDR